MDMFAHRNVDKRKAPLDPLCNMLESSETRIACSENFFTNNLEQHSNDQLFSQQLATYEYVDKLEICLLNYTCY